MAPLRKEDHENYNDVMQQLLQLLYENINTASREGVKLCSGVHLHPIPLGSKGDWSYLVPFLRCVMFVYVCDE